MVESGLLQAAAAQAPHSSQNQDLGDGSCLEDYGRELRAFTFSTHLYGHLPKSTSSDCLASKPQIWTTRKLHMVSTRFHYEPGLRFSALMTFNFEGQLQTKLAGSLRPNAVGQLAEMPQPNRPIKQAQQLATNKFGSRYPQ